MTLLEHALALAAKGFHVFPLVPNSKFPLIEDFPNQASRDPEVIKKWWIDPVLGLEQPYNIGISTSKFGDDEALVVVDVDNKGEMRGDEEVLKLELEGKEFPPTYTQETPTGGRHFIYRTKHAVKQGASVLAKGLDIRSRGGYIVGRGSILNGGVYKNRDTPVMAAPEWIIQSCGRPTEKDNKPKKKIKDIDERRAEKRAIHYLENEAPVATQGERNHKGYAVACRVKDFGVDEATCLSLLIEHWKCEPMLEHSELEHVIASAYKHGVNSIGADSPEAQFPDAVPTETENLNYLQKMNEEYALIYVEGGHFILHETVNEKGQAHRVFLTETTFKRRFSPFTIEQQSKGRPLTYAEKWLDWKGRREFKGLCFTPEREPRNGYYNLWRGFSCKPVAYADANEKARKGFDMFIEHAKENVCHGSEDLFNWLLGYFAHMIQKPYERPLTTLVFKGSKGVGKNALTDRIGHLLGSSHYLVAHDSRYLTSNFNGHLDSCLCLVLDEAFWSGDKSAEGKLKGLTTAPEILIERKGKEPYTVSNLVRLIVIGNEHWLVPASHDERRYAVFNVGEGKKQNSDYFYNMRINLERHGGDGVLLDYLQTFDLNKVDVNKAPSTAGLLEQKVSSLDPFKQWWFDCLSHGRITGSDFEGDWQVEVDKDEFRSAFRRYIKERQISSRIPSEDSIGKQLKSILPSTISNQKRRDGMRTIYVYRLPELNQARQEWARFIGHDMTWE